MASEGDKKIEYMAQPDGSVVREVSTFLGAGFVGTGGKVVAKSVAEFRERFPDAKIANMVQEAVVKTAPVDLRQKVAQLSDEELEAMGLARVDAKAKTQPDPNAIPKDFPGDFALRRAGVDVETLQVLTREDLIAIDGIGAKLADKILAARAERYPVVPTE